MPSRPFLLASAFSFLSCAGERPANLGVAGGQLTPCPSSPNCVSSDATDDRHGVAAFRYKGSPEAVWAEVVAAVNELPRTTVVTERLGYLHAESATRVFRFVDDLEMHMRPYESVIAVRSAARLGKFDFGVNRRRVERLRTMLGERNILR